MYISEEENDDEGSNSCESSRQENPGKHVSDSL